MVFQLTGCRPQNWMQIKMADMARRITLAQLLSLQLGRLKDAGTMQPSQVSLAKWNNARMALNIAREARDILGASGITTEFCPIRHMLNLESVVTYEGTETIHELAVGRELTGHVLAQHMLGYPAEGHVGGEVVEWVVGIGEHPEQQ